MKKLKLDVLQVQSFTTSVDARLSQTIRGGSENCNSQEVCDSKDDLVCSHDFAACTGAQGLGGCTVQLDGCNAGTQFD